MPQTLEVYTVCVMSKFSMSSSSLGRHDVIGVPHFSFLSFAFDEWYRLLGIKTVILFIYGHFSVDINMNSKTLYVDISEFLSSLAEANGQI